MKSNYLSLSERIRSSKTEEQVEKYVSLACKLQQLGLITNNQLMRLDQISVDKLIALEEQT